MDYQNGKIYTIRSHQTDDFYIGSTCQPLYKRFGQHKNDYKNINKIIKMSSYEIIKYNDCYIELLEIYPCSSKVELHKREGELIRLHNCVNKCIPSRTQKEYHEDNKEIIDIYQKKYREENKEINIEYQKKYYENNKEYLIEKVNEYRLNNLEKIKERKKIKTNCECGSIYNLNAKCQHIKSKKHITFINLKN